MPVLHLQAKIEKEGERFKVSTIAGNGNYGFVDGSPDQSEFKQVTALTVSNGILYAWDRDERQLIMNNIIDTASSDVDQELIDQLSRVMIRAENETIN